MMKRLFPTALAVLLLLLAGCTAKPDTSNQSKPAEYYLTDTDLPLDDAAQLRAAPDFLTAEQQTLYRQAFALYSAMFDGETTGIDDAFPAADGQAEYDEYTPDGSDYTYISSHSRWQSWADFDRVVYADEVNWISVPGLTEPLRVTARTRYHQVEQPATVFPAEGGFRLEFDQPQRAPTPGQAVVLYDGEQNLLKLLQPQEDMKYIVVVPRIDMVSTVRLPNAPCLFATVDFCGQDEPEVRFYSEEATEHED